MKAKPLLILPIFIVFFVSFIPLASANYGPPINFDNNVWIKTTTDNVYFDITELNNPVNYLGIENNLNRIYLKNDNSQYGETYSVSIQVTPFEKTVDVTVLDIDEDAGEGNTALKLKMEDLYTSQNVDLSVSGLLGRIEYVLYNEEEEKIDQDRTDSSGSASFEISNISSVYKVVRAETGSPMPPFDPTKQEMSIDLQVGLYEGEEPGQGGEIQFKPSSKFKPGDGVTVIAYLTVDGMEISHADIKGWLPTSWSKSIFAMEDEYGNKFVGTFTVPEDAKQGSYLVAVDASARNLQSTVSKTITVKGVKGVSPIDVVREYWWVVAIIVVLLLLIALS